ncbi:MAG TPA: tetratricopeptide repeat protein [Rhodanobacteraceae bacterium]|nr:tetratricopeptide repeat protein [Rhodanobacteraceae bacterium]
MSAIRDSWSSRIEAALRLAQSGALEAAIEELSRLREERPREPLPHLLLATLYQQQGETPAALSEIELALRLAPDDPNALLVRTRLFLAVHRHAEAELDAKRVLALVPGHPRALFDLACAFEAQQRWHEAATACRSVMASQPGQASARQLLVRCRLMMGEVEGALAEASHPAVLAETDSALAVARDFGARGMHEQRIAFLRRLVEMHPGDYACAMALADALHAGQRTSEAMEWAQRASALRPDASRPLLMHAAGRIERGETQAGLAGFRRLLAEGRLDAVDEQRYLIALHYDPEQQPGPMYAAHLAWAKRHARVPAVSFPDAVHGLPLRIGWLSPRFNEGPVARFLSGLLAAFDREQQHHVLIELHNLRDARTDDLEHLSDEVVAVHGLDDESLRERLRSLQLDVLIDLAGHAPFGRPKVLAQRVARVQISWLDWFDTTGLPNMDAWISDPWLSPPDSPQRFSERLLRLQSGRLCYTPPDCAPEPSYQGDGAIRLVSFNRTAKLNDRVIAAWSRILEAIPDAQLIVGAGELDDPGARLFLGGRFRQCGIDPARLEFQGQRDYASLLSAYRHADIALDPFPFSGCTTSCDALWMGVPVVTLPDWSVISRQTASLLWRLERPDWVARDVDDYVARTISLAGAADELRQQRTSLRKAVDERLCNASAQAQEFAALLRRLVEERRDSSRR